MIDKMVQNVSEFNNKFSAVINEVARKRLGVTVNMQCISDKYGTLEDTIKTDVDKKMRGNKALRQLFSKIWMDGCAYEDADSGEVQVRLQVHYAHTMGGGFNGHDVLTFWMNKDGKVLKVQNK